MLNSSLMDIIKVLSPAELKGLGEYVRSPLFNKNKNVIRLFDYIHKLSPGYPPEKMKKTYVYRKLFGEGRFNDGFMRTLIFIITRLAEDYIAYLGFVNDRFSSQISLLSELNRRNVTSILSRSIRNADKQFKAEKNKDDNYYRALYELEIIRNESQVSKGKTLNTKEVADDLTSVILEYHTVQFLITTFKNYIFILNRRHLVNVEFDFIFLEETLSHLEANQKRYSSVPLLMLLYNQLRLNLDPDNEVYYKEMKKIVLSEENSLNYIDRYNGIVGLQNFCMRQHNAGKPGFINEYFNMLDFILEGGYYSAAEGGDFHPQNFKNFVIVALNVSEFEWAENFIRNYSKKLSPADRDNAYNFSMAKVYFGKKDFEKALGFISRVSYGDLYYKLEVRNLTLMIFFELSMFSEADDLMESYKKFIINNKLLSSVLRAKHLFFIKYTGELLKVKLSGNTARLRHVEKEIKKPGPSLGVSWMNAKVNEIYSRFERI